jgi:hypothetical protein
MMGVSEAERGCPMGAVRGTYRNGQVFLDGPPPADWKDGAAIRIELAAPDESVGVRVEDRPTTPEEIAELLAKMDQVEPPFLTPEEEAEWKRALAEHKAWELANWDKHSREIEDLFR